MAYLDPNQQLAMAAGQLQQQVQQPFAMPGAYNAPSYATQTERAATTLTQGLTNVALPGAALATSIGGSFAVPVGAMAKAGARIGTMGRGLQAAGTFGRVAGVGLGGTAALAGLALPLLAAAGIEQAASRMIEGQREFMATRQLMRELPGQSMFGAQSVLSPIGMGPAALASNPYQVSSMQQNLASIGANYGASSGQMRNIVGQLAPMGMLDTSSVSSISSSLRRSMQELTRIAKMVGSDLDEATKVYGQLKQMGFDTMSSRTSALRQLTGASSMSGMSLSQVSGIASGSIATAGALGLSSDVGLRAATTSISNAALRYGSGTINPIYMQQMGGLEGYAQRLAEINMGVVGSQGAMGAMSQMFDPSGRLRAGGLEEALSGNVRMRSSFGREFDPYRLGAMRRQFQGMSRSVILGGVASIQSEYSGAEANRRQYEFLSQFGISDPTEQLEYLDSLRAQPRAQAMMTAQTLQNQAVQSAQVPEIRTVTERLGDALSRLTRQVFGTGESLERFGASLQQRSERFVNDITTGVMGTAPSALSPGRYTAEALNTTRSAILSGQGAIADPMTRFRHELTTDPNLRELLGRSTAITGGRGFMGGLSEASFNARFGSYVGMSGTADTGIAVGGGAFMTPDELIQSAALSQGMTLDPTTGRVRSVGEGDVSRLMYHRGDALGALERRLTYGRRRLTGMGRRGFGRPMFGGDSFVEEGGNYQLTERDITEIQGPLRGTLENQFLRALYPGRPVGDITPQERAVAQEVMRRSPGAIGAALAGPAGTMSPDQLAASLADTARAQGQTELFSRISRGSQREQLDTAMRAVRSQLNAGDADRVESILRSRQQNGFVTANDVEEATRAVLVGNANSRGRGSARLGITGAEARRAAVSRAERQAGEAFRGMGLGDPAAASQMTDELRQIIEGGQGLTGLGGAVGAAMGARDTGNLQSLRNFIRTGEGEFASLEGDALREAVRAYALSTDASREQIDALLAEASAVGNEGVAARADALRGMLIEGSDLAVPGMSKSTVLGIRNAASMDSGILSGVLDQANRERMSQLLAGSTVVNARSREALSQMGLNILSEGGLARVLGTSSGTYGGMSVAEIDRAVRQGTLTAEQASEILQSTTLMEDVNAVAGGGGPQAEQAQRLRNRLMQIVVGQDTASPSQVLTNRLTNMLEDNAISGEELAELGGLNIATNMQALSKLLAGEGDMDSLAALFGNLSAAEEFASGMDTDVDGLLERIQGGNLSATAQRDLISALVGVAGLGQDETRRQNEQEMRELEETFYRNMNAALEGNALSVAVVAMRGEHPFFNFDGREDQE